jgi:hypothetical protein
MALEEHRPGERAPYSGHYEQCDVLGVRTGKVAYVREGDELPAAPLGFAWRPPTRRSVTELRAEAAEYRRLSESAVMTPVITALREIADRFDALADQRKQTDDQALPSSPVEGLIDDINQTAAMQPRPLDTTMSMIKLAIATDSDPYLLVGSLIEGMTIAIAVQVPPARQNEVAAAAWQLLRDRLRAYNLL